MDSRSPIGSGTGQAGLAFLVGARLWRTRKDILISYLSPPMSLRFYFMSLRVLPQKDAAISPSPFVPTITRRLLRRCAPRNDTVKRVSLRVHPSFRKEAKQSHPTFPIVPTRRLPRYARNDTVERMSLRGHPSFRKEAKQSHRPHSYQRARGDCHATLAMTR